MISETKENTYKKTRPARPVIYVVGLLILALGQALNTKTGLGVSPLTSVPYTLSLITGVSFGNAFMGVGAGTVIGVLCIGRVMFLFNKAFKGKLLKAAGLEN